MNDLAGMDLNLVVALHALLEEQSVTAAARRVGLSQPAMSHALSRLREHFDDPLLIRSGRAMVLTARARGMIEPLREIVSRLERLLVHRAMDPSGLASTVRLVTDDFIGTTVLPSLLQQIRAAAPLLEVDVIQRGPPGRKRMLRRGQADLAVGDFSGAGMDLHRANLAAEDWVCVLRRGHPVARSRLSAEAWARLEHVIVSPTGGRRGVVDTVLAEAGLTRRVPIAVPHFLTALAVVSRSALVCTVPRRLAEAHADHFGLSILPAPLPLPPLVLALLWHGRTDQDPAHRWFREQILAAFLKLPAGAHLPPGHA